MSKPCYDYWGPTGIGTGGTPSIGTYILCSIDRFIGSLQLIFIAFAIILVMYLLYKTVTKADDPKALQEIQKRP